KHPIVWFSDINEVPRNTPMIRSVIIWPDPQSSITTNTASNEREIRVSRLFLYSIGCHSDREHLDWLCARPDCIPFLLGTCRRRVHVPEQPQASGLPGSRCPAGYQVRWDMDLHAFKTRC